MLSFLILHRFNLIEKYFSEWICGSLFLDLCDLLKKLIVQLINLQNIRHEHQN